MKTAVPHAPAPSKTNDGLAELRRQYGCGPVKIAGTDDALYERHLYFDNVINPAAVSPRERFEAFARSNRDVLSQRWVRTEETYERENPKRVYYLSMEYLIGRSLANNVTNLLLGPFVRHLSKEKDLDWLALLEQEPDAGLGNGGLGRLAACFLDSMATMQIPAMGYGLRYEYGIFRQTIKDGWQEEQPDNWLRQPGPLGGAAPQRECGSEAELLVPTTRRSLESGPRQAVQPDRHSLRSARRGLRRQEHQHAPPLGRRRAGCFRLSCLQSRRLRGRGCRVAGCRVADAGALSRRFDQHGAGAALCAGVLSCRLFAGRHCTPFPPPQCRLEPPG